MSEYEPLIQAPVSLNNHVMVAFKNPPTIMELSNAIKLMNLIDENTYLTINRE